MPLIFFYCSISLGQGKFGSVWRGSLGTTPVAVKLYSNSNTWHKEAAIYALPHLAHPNILRYYGKWMWYINFDCVDSRVVEVTTTDRLRATCHGFDPRVGWSFVWFLNACPDFVHVNRSQVKLRLIRLVSRWVTINAITSSSVFWKAYYCN